MAEVAAKLDDDTMREIAAMPVSPRYLPPERFLK
jgi:hypothetical protein